MNCLGVSYEKQLERVQNFRMYCRRAFFDGEAVLSLTVNAAPEEPDLPKTELDIPKTGDDEPVFLWLVLISIGAIGMAAVVFFGRKRIIQKRDQ